ncbi:VWA domain-containing protein [Streptomyces sp. NBC_00683]|uniref:hypothetical protein n=1 Tax=Streptomyces sp. NBC_00683 TaxID=2903670 RepID=UPI002E321356|nr:hypothetical protein [Streptomyces sp. NBC_00683]
MHVAIAVAAPRGYLDYLAIDGARFCVEMALRSFGGPPAGFWVFQRKPVRIPVPGPEEMARWADEWFARDDPVDAMRGKGRGNAAERFVKKNQAFGPGEFTLAPTLQAIIEATGDLAGHTVAVVVLTSAPGDGAAVIATLKRAARYPVFWVFVGANYDIERVLHLGVLDTLGERPDDPENILVLKTSGWGSEFGGWWRTRQIKKASGRWRRRAPLG